MQIETSTDWQVVGTNLVIQLHKLPYNRDLTKMYKNIEVMIDDLSKLEVEARRRKKPEYTKEKVNSINKAIDHLEKLMLIAKLVS